MSIAIEDTKAGTEAETDKSGYVDAFYAIADILGIQRPQPLSPKRVFEEQMLPKLKARAADEIERLQAELASIKAGPIVYGRVPPLHERIVPAQGDEVVRMLDQIDHCVLGHACRKPDITEAMRTLGAMSAVMRAALATPTTEER